MDQAFDPSKSAGVLSAFEKSIELKWSLVLLSFVLFADLALSQITAGSLYDLLVSPEKIDAAFAICIAVVFVFYSVFMSMYVPIFLFIFNFLFNLTPLWSLINNIIHSERGGLSSSSGYVSMNQLREKAHLTKDDYYLELYRSEKEMQEAEREQDTKLALLGFGNFVLVVAELFCSSRPGTSILLGHITLHTGDYGALCIMVLLLAFGFMTLRPLFQDYYDRMVYCPTFANEIEEERRKSRTERGPPGRSLSRQH